jgi:hypothetical protein
MVRFTTDFAPPESSRLDWKTGIVTLSLFTADFAADALPESMRLDWKTAWYIVSFVARVAAVVAYFVFQLLDKEKKVTMIIVEKKVSMDRLLFLLKRLKTTLEEEEKVLKEKDKTTEFNISCLYSVLRSNPTVVCRS